MKKAAEETISITQRTMKGWYKISKDIVNPLIKQQSRILHWTINDQSLTVDEKKERCRDAQKNANDAVKLAKTKWASNLANTVSTLKNSPKEAWKGVRELQEGYAGHHVKPAVMRLRMPDGTLSKCDREHMQIFRSHFSKVFNNKQTVDWDVLNAM